MLTQIQDHTNQQSVALSIKSTKITARLLAKAMQAFLKRARSPTLKHGKQSLKSLSKQGASIENIEVSGDDVGSFKKIARKYHIDFAIKKDESTSPPNWIVFFKSRDSKSLDLAFKEYSREVLKHKTQKPSMSTELERFKDIAKGTALPALVKGRDKDGIEL